MRGNILVNGPLSRRVLGNNNSNPFSKENPFDSISNHSRVNTRSIYQKHSYFKKKPQNSTKEHTNHD